MSLVEQLHGREVADPYRWLEADDDPECTRWLAQQDRWYASHAAQWPSRAGFAELLRRHSTVGGGGMATVSPPVWRLFDLRRAPSDFSLAIGVFAGCSAIVLDG